MLEITISDSDKKVLKDTNIFSNNNIMSFCLLLCFGALTIHVCEIKIIRFD